jgi:hypothetical protein
VAALETLVYFIGYHRPAWVVPPPSILAAIGTGARVLGYAFGPVAALSGRVSVPLAMVILMPTAVLVLVAALRAVPVSRPRAAGMVCFGAAMLALALGIGWGRAAELTTIGLPGRYVIFAVPAFCWTFYAWQLDGAPVPRRVLQLCLFVAALGTLYANTREGFIVRDWYDEGAAAVQRDIDAGMNAEQIADRNAPFLMHWNKQELAHHIELLRRAHIGPFARVAERR